MCAVPATPSRATDFQVQEVSAAPTSHSAYAPRTTTDPYGQQAVHKTGTMSPRIDVQPPSRAKKNTLVYPSIVVSSDAKFDGLYVVAVDSAGRELGDFLRNADSVAPEYLDDSTGGGSSSEGRWYTAITNLEIKHTGPVKLYLLSFTSDEVGNITYGWNMTTRRIEVERGDVATQLGTAAEQAVLDRLRQYDWFGVPELAAPTASANGGSSRRRR